jgi:hypothetical protein
MKHTKNHWTTVVDCHLCKKQTPTKESYITENYCSAFGVAGHWNVIICKECHREKQLSKLI